MVEGLGEFAVELVSGVLEGAFEWLLGGGSTERGGPDHAHDEAASRYADSLYEERRPPPPGLPQELNR